MTYLHKTVTARKAHTCSLCMRRIEPGERYMRGTGIDGGDIWNWRECAHCDAVMKLYDIQQDFEYGEGDFEAWVDWNRDRYGLALTKDPTQVRHAAQWSMRWRTRFGTLAPVPHDSGSPS